MNAVADPVDDLVREHLPLVRKMANAMKRGLPPAIDIDDLIASGNVGLWKSAQRFNPAFGAKFQTYATPRIIGAMNDWLRESSGFFDSRKVARAKKSGFATPRVKQFGANRFEDRHHGEGISYADPRASRPFEDSDDRDAFRQMIRGLNKKGRTILTLHYLEGLTLGESGRAVGFSESRASQILSAALEFLRAKLTPMKS